MTSTRRCILGVFAHPDDETSCAGGTLLRPIWPSRGVPYGRTPRKRMRSVLARFFEQAPWAVETFHQAYLPTSAGVMATGFWECPTGPNDTLRA